VIRVGIRDSVIDELDATVRLQKWTLPDGGDAKRLRALRAWHPV
jgi:hypothetical protein